MAMADVVSLPHTGGPVAQVRRLGPNSKGRQPSGAVLEPYSAGIDFIRLT